MSKLLTLTLIVMSIAFFGQRSDAEEVVTIQSLLHEMTDRDELARFPRLGFRLKQASSYNRASKTPDDPEGWFDNFDRSTTDKHHNFVRIEENDGRKEWVVMDHDGGGAITRFWVPWPNQLKPESNMIIRFYLDGATEPVIERNMFDLFRGKGMVPFPLAHESLRSAVSFFPIPYAKSCKVTMSDHPFFFQFTYREYADGVAVKTFTMEDFQSAKALIDATCQTLLNPGSGTRGEFRSVGEAPKVLTTSAAIATDEETKLQLTDGGHAIRTLSLKLGSYEDPEVTRTVVLKIDFDGKETVWCPIGDFFGCGIGLNPFQDWYRTVSEDGTLSCRWVMPYQSNATISIVNLGSDPIEVDLAATVDDWKWDARSLYFHAGWRGQYPVPTRPYSDWNYINLTGRGVYVGDTLTIMNPVERWWGEGDEKIFVDGEDFPSIFGTGTEDYYAYSWGGRSTDFYEHPFHAQTFSHKYNKLNRKTVDDKNTQGYSTETRTRALDTMPFSKSLKLDMEVWSWTDCDMGYGVGCYWYGDAETTSNQKPDPAGARAIPPLPAEMTEPALSRSGIRQEFRESGGRKVLTTSANQAQPNIVLLISDDDDYEHFGFMGDKIARTPTLDALAESGTLFTMAHCPAPLCRPSLASLLSGKLPHQHGIYANYLQSRSIGGDKIKLDPTGSLANRLKDAGYATYATAKYWEGDLREMGFTHGSVDITFKGFQQFVRKDQSELNQFIDQQGRDKPMFIWWAPLLPHKPHNPPAKYMDRFADAEIEIPAFFKGDREQYVKALRDFYAMGNWFDDGVSDLIEKLKASGEYENTIFLFYVDNGYSFGMPAKNSPTEKGLRTPLLVSWPGKPGQIPVLRIDDLNYALDLHATALDYAGIEPPTDIASKSLRPRIEGEQADAKETIFGAVFAHSPAAYSGDPSVEQSVQRDVYALYARTDRWKYVLYTQDITTENDRYIWMIHELSDAFGRDAGDENLYDLDADPYEQDDVSAKAENRELITKLRREAFGWWEKTGGTSLAVEPKLLTEVGRSISGTRQEFLSSAEPMKVLTTSATEAPPNFVVIFTDDQGYQDVGCFGAPDIRTPRLDGMAREGMKFTSFYAQTICGPSRAALMTGCYPTRVAERGNIKHLHPELADQEITVAEILKTKGYATGCFGKWDLAGHSQTDYVPELLPNYQGFDYFFGTPTSNDGKVNLIRNEELVEDGADMGTLTERYTDEAIGFIERNRDKPFFVYLPHTMPHIKLAASKRFAGKSTRGLYGDVIEELDFNIGRIIDSLNELKLADNTYVLFTSDNGPWLWKNKDQQDGHLPSDVGGSAGELRSGKVSTFEGGVRVPTILWGPGRVPAGTTCNKIASTLDVLPTLAALAGAEVPTDRVIDGEDISSLFHGEFDKANPHKTFYYYQRSQLQAVRQGKWKLILPRASDPSPFRYNPFIAPVDRKAIPHSMLFDLDSDLSETTDVADKKPEVVARLTALAEVMLEDIGDTNHVGKNMRFFDLAGPRPTRPTLQVKNDYGKPELGTN